MFCFGNKCANQHTDNFHIVITRGDKTSHYYPESISNSSLYIDDVSSSAPHYVNQHLNIYLNIKKNPKFIARAHIPMSLCLLTLAAQQSGYSLFYGVLLYRSITLIDN